MPSRIMLTAPNLHQGVHPNGHDHKSPVAVTAAHRRGHVDVSLARVEELPFGDDSFHLVTCLDVIEHTRDDTRALGELLRVTRPGGYLLVTAPAYPSLWSSHDDRNDHFRRYRRRTLRAVAANAGWQLMRDTHFNSLLWRPQRRCARPTG